MTKWWAADAKGIVLAALAQRRGYLRLLHYYAYATHATHATTLTLRITKALWRESHRLHAGLSPIVGAPQGGFRDRRMAGCPKTWFGKTGSVHAFCPFT